MRGVSKITEITKESDARLTKLPSHPFQVWIKVIKYLGHISVDAIDSIK
jgi:hypothetical protein